MAATLSRQLQWQWRQVHLGNCRLCGKPAMFRSYCVDCAVKRRERARKKNGFKRRYNAASYRLAQEDTPQHDQAELIKRIRARLNEPFLINPGSAENGAHSNLSLAAKRNGHRKPEHSLAV